MTYKALFLDIDGTILKPDHTYTDLTKEAIMSAKNQGIAVFLATGRPAHEIANLAEDLGIDSLIGYNGAYATYRGEILVNETMKPDIVKRYLQITKEQGNEMVLYTNKNNLYTTLDHSIVNDFIDLFQLKQNERFDEKYINDILSITLLDMDSVNPKHFNIDSNIHLSPVHLKGAEHSYDVIRKNVNKGEAIKVLLNKLNISSNEAIAFGDGMNDKEMLQVVGHGFAMGNAHTDLFEYARYRTTTVHESGIYNGLRKLGLV
ncbi:MAG TPA: HAD family hydrolase [Candidatus Avamphibacillus sp.]|nr:HAD family hydrolase [Candidatus Avamphibacillus sp.]